MWMLLLNKDVAIELNAVVDSVDQTADVKD